MEEVSLDPALVSSEVLIAGLIDPILEIEIHTRGVIDDHNHIPGPCLCLHPSE